MRDFIVKILLHLGLYRPMIAFINQIKFKQQVRKMRKNGLEMLQMADQAFTSMGVHSNSGPLDDSADRRSLLRHPY